jgi:PAS domain-containing protein
MEDSGFTREEMTRLTASKQNSDLLVSIERDAMARVESGDVTPEQRLAAVRSLSDARYQRAKADIMRPLAEAGRLVKTRTAGKLAAAESHALGALLLFAAAGATLLFSLWWAYRQLQRVFGGSVSQLRATVMSTGDTAELAAALANGGDKDSIIGKLVEAQQVRSNDDGRRSASEQAVSEAERRLRSVVGALDEGVCVVQDALIRFVNDKLQEILERAEPDLVDRPFIQFVHDDDRTMLMERYRKRVAGIEISPEISFRICSSPGVLRGAVSRATEFEWAGRPATLYFVNLI